MRMRNTSIIITSIFALVTIALLFSKSSIESQPWDSQIIQVGNNTIPFINIQQPCTYQIYSLSNTYYARNCLTSVVENSSSSAYTVINYSIRTLNSTSKGGVVHITPGYYNISNTIIMASGITIEGEGFCSFTNNCSTHLRLADSTNKDMFQYNSTKYGNAMGMTFRNIFLDGNHAHNSSNGTANGIYFIGAKVFDPFLFNVYIDGFNNHCFRQDSGAWNTHIVESIFEHCSFDGIFIDGGSGSTSSTDVSIIQSKFLSNNQYGVELGSSANGGIASMRFIGNYIAGNSKFNMVTWNLQQAIYSSNTFQESNNLPPSTGDDLALENNCSNSVVANNVFIGAGHTRHAIFIPNGSCTNTIVNSNSIAGTFSSTLISDSGTTTKIRDNLNYITENSGTATMLNAGTTIVVTHGLSYTPSINDIYVIPQSAWHNCGNYWVSTITSTQFTINCSVAVNANTAFSWSIKRT